MDVRKNMKPPTGYPSKSDIKMMKCSKIVREGWDLMDMDNNDQFMVMCRHQRKNDFEDQCTIIKWYDRQEQKDIK